MIKAQGSRLMLICAALFFLASCGPPSYRYFMTRDKAYFEKIAAACDIILSEEKHVPDTWVKSPGQKGAEYHIKGGDKSLPAIIRSLHASKIRVVFDNKSGSRVWMGIGISGDIAGGFGLTWEQIDTVDHLWALRVFAEDGGTTVYTRAK
jgi:hypothetical protein